MFEDPPLQLPGTPLESPLPAPIVPTPAPLPVGSPQPRRTRVPKDEKKSTPVPAPLAPPTLLPPVVTPTLLDGGGSAAPPPLAPVPVKLEKTRRTPKSPLVLPPVVAPTVLQPTLPPSLASLRTKINARGAMKALQTVPAPFGGSRARESAPERVAGGGSSRDEDTETMSTALVPLLPAAKLPLVGAKPSKNWFKESKIALPPSVKLSGAGGRGGGGSSQMKIEPIAPKGRAASGSVPAPVLLVPASQIGTRTEKLKPESGFENGLPIAFRGDRGERPVQGGKPASFFNPPAASGAEGAGEAIALVPVPKGPKNKHLVDIRKHGNEAKKAKTGEAEGVEALALVPAAAPVPLVAVAPKGKKPEEAPEPAPVPAVAAGGEGPLPAPVPVVAAAPAPVPGKGKKRSHDIDIRKGNEQKKARKEPAAAAAPVLVPAAAPVAVEPLGRGHRVKKAKDPSKTGGKSDRFFPGSFDKGGRVKKTQLALVHKGEVVLTKKLAKKLKDLITQ